MARSTAARMLKRKASGVGVGVKKPRRKEATKGKNGGGVVVDIEDLVGSQYHAMSKEEMTTFRALLISW